MKAIEFPTKIRKDKNIVVPDKYKKELRENQKARVIILLETEKDERAWEELTTDQFFNGYLVKDAAYDKL
ncbi:MAG: hypothetical protein EHM58_13690 [Ignavibacteriae bacterium]|nr:MAG: hypothetical protein EHM58_13690 [Ignavibacteriota bacterium]